MSRMFYILQHTDGQTLDTVFRNVSPAGKPVKVCPGPPSQLVTKAEGLLRLHELKIYQSGKKTGRTSHTRTSTPAPEPRQSLTWS